MKFPAKFFFIASVLAFLLWGGGKSLKADECTMQISGFLINSSGDPCSGALNITTDLYSAASGGTSLYSETDTVTCNDGLFAYDFGDCDSLGTAFTANVGDFYVGITPEGDSQLDPRTRLTACSTAQVALTVASGAVGTATLVDSSVTTAKISDGTIAAADLADSSVTSAKILDGTIATADLADSSVTTAKISDATIAAADIASDAVEAAEIATGAVTTTEILDGTVATADLADSAVTSAKISNGVIAAADLDLSMAPTWTGAHTFSSTATYNGQATFNANVDYSLAGSESLTVGNTSPTSDVLALSVTSSTSGVDGLSNTCTLGNSGTSADTIYCEHISSTFTGSNAAQVLSGSFIEVTNNTTGGITTAFAVRVNDGSRNMTEIADLLLADTGGTVDEGLLIRATAGTITDGIQIGSAAETITNGIRMATSAMTTDIILQNGETIDNDTDGTVLINDSTGTALISSSLTTTSLNLTNARAGMQTLCHSAADTGTGVANIYDCDGTQTDIAEYFGSDGSLEAGDLVAPAREAMEFKGPRGGSLIKAFVAKAGEPSGAIGVVSTNPFRDVLGEGVFKKSENPVPVALTGRVPVKVSAENGPVEVGDYLTASPSPGMAMKATEAGSVIGVALSSLKKGKGKVVAFLQPGYFDPTPAAKNLPALSGDVVVRPGERSIRLHFPKALKVKPHLVVTPHSNPGGFFWISDLTEKGFVLNLSSDAPGEIPFQWIAITD